MDLLFRTGCDLAAASNDAAAVVGALAGELLGVSAARDGPASLLGPASAPRRATIIALGLISSAHNTDTQTALDIVRAYAGKTSSTIDDVAGLLVSRHLAVTELLS